MCGIESVGDFDSQLQQSFQLHPFCVDAMLQGHAIEKFHRDERLAILLADIIDRANVGMVQCGCGLSFAVKARQGLRIAGNFLGQKLEGDKAMQADVLGLVDDTHPTTAQLLGDSIVRDGFADHWKTLGFRVRLILRT